MESNSYDKMVQEKKARQELGHSFVEKFIIQATFEPKKFLLWRYNKKVGTLTIPTGLCDVCNKLEIEHND